MRQWSGIMGDVRTSLPTIGLWAERHTYGHFRRIPVHPPTTQRSRAFGCNMWSRAPETRSSFSIDVVVLLVLLTVSRCRTASNRMRFLAVAFELRQGQDHVESPVACSTQWRRTPLSGGRARARQIGPRTGFPHECGSRAAEWKDQGPGTSDRRARSSRSTFCTRRGYMTSGEEIPGFGKPGETLGALAM